MTLQIITADSIGTGTQINLGTSDDLFVADNVIVVTTDFGEVAIEGTGNHHVDIQGTVSCYNLGLHLGNITSSGQTLIVGEDALIEAKVPPPNFFTPTTVGVYGDGAFVENRGTIRGFSEGLQVGGNDPSSVIRIFNYGLIEASTFGVGAFGTCSVDFVNTGEVRTHHPNGSSYLSTFSDVLKDHVTNSGLMVGDVTLGKGDDIYDGIGDGRVVGDVLGEAGNDVLRGGGFADRLDGGVGQDQLDGAGGDDTLDGGLGADSMNGGTGNDSFTVDDGGDVVADSAGVDTVSSSVSFNFNTQAVGTLEILQLTGSAGTSGIGNAAANTINGNDGGNFLFGMGGNDIVSGAAGNDRLDGNAGNDVLNGGVGNDKLIGGLGRDVLTGGLGSDQFVFVVRAKGNADVIADFTRNVDDMLMENAVFKALGGAGSLKAGFFHAGKAAHDANDHIIYNRATGALFYDDDGTGAHAQVQFATLASRPAITAHDFMVI